MTPITQKFVQKSLLGLNLGAQVTPAGGSISDNNDGNAASGGKFRNFTGGTIYWKENLGAREIHGSIFNEYRDLGFEYPSGSTPGLGFPISDEKSGILYPVNRYSEFEHGVLYWHNNTYAVDVLSPIVVPHPLSTSQIATIIQNSLGRTMNPDVTFNPASIIPIIQNVLPYAYHQISYPEGGRPFEIFTNRRYRVTFNMAFTGRASGIAHCEIYLEFKTNLIGQIVFVLRDFHFSLDFPLSLIIWCIGGSIDDNVLPMCNEESVVDLSSLPLVPANSRFLCAHINTPMISTTGSPKDLLLYVEPAS